MAEEEIREKLAKIDYLRAEADVAEKMHSHWMGSRTELVEIEERKVIVRRRWWSTTPALTHSEIIMTPTERDLFCDWLVTRVWSLRSEADAIAASLGSGESR